MNNYLHGLGLIMACLLNTAVQAAHVCPDPLNSSLRWGEPPKPWLVNPFSSHSPQGEDDAKFVKADILVNSGLGIGVSCTYRISIGDYSIWWPVKVKRPSRQDKQWIETVSGYVCTDSFAGCEFYVALENN